MKQQELQNLPPLIPEDFFQGNLKAWGLFQDRFGRVCKRFDVNVNGVWNAEDKILTLTEDFVYSDGSEEQRIWTLYKEDDAHYTGEAPGVIGKAKGKIEQSAFHFEYLFALPVNGKRIRVRFKDLMVLQSENLLFNKASLSKFGIKLGEVYIFFSKDI